MPDIEPIDYMTAQQTEPQVVTLKRRDPLDSIVLLSARIVALEAELAEVLRENAKLRAEKGFPPRSVALGKPTATPQPDGSFDVQHNFKYEPANRLVRVDVT